MKNFNFNFKHLFVLSAMLLLGSTQVWGAGTQVTFTANATSGQRGYVGGSDVDTLIRGQVTLKLDSLGSKTQTRQIYNSSADKEASWGLSSSATSDANKNYIELKASSGYNITGMQIRLAPNGTTESRCIAVCFASAFSMENNSVLDTISIPLLSNTNDNSASHTITLSGIPSGTGCIRIYKAVRYDGTHKKLVNTKGTVIWASSSAQTAYIPWIKVTYEAVSSGYTLTASPTVINPMTENSKTGAITTTITNSPVTGITSGTTTSTSSNTFTVAKATPVMVTAPRTVAGTSAQCDECTYRFDSWENIPASVTADVSNIHAKYNTTYTISFKETDESAVDGISSTYYVYGTGKAVSSYPTPTKSGFNFNGWYQENTLTNAATNIGTTAYGNVAVYAKWTEVCADPTLPTNGAGTTTTQTVSWTAGDSETEWDVYYSTSSGTPAADQTPTYSPTSASYTFTGLTAGTTYYWWVRAKCSETSKSDWVAGTSFTTRYCDEYSFHYGPNGGSWETPICFTQVGETHEWNIENFTIPSHANGEFWVGYAGATNGQSVTKRWTDGLSDTGSGIMNGAMVLLPTNGSIVGQASGATGTLSIWDNSSSKNQYVGFKPDGYAIMYGGNNYAFSETATSNVWETDLLTLPDVSTTYQVGIKTSSSYTTCSHSKSAEALSAPGNTMLKDGKKYIYLNAGVWRTNAEGRPDDVNEKMAVWDATNVSGEWGNGGNFLTYNKATGLYEGYVSSSTTKIVLTRILNSRESLGNSWGDNVNKQTDDITLTAVNNEFTITGWGDSRSPYTAAAHSHPATGDNGKFRMYDNSNDANWYVHWIPYYKLSYDGNGGTGSVAAQYRNSELSTSPLIVAANGFSREGWTFTGWNTEKHGKGTAYDPDDNIDITGDVTLYAQWERDIYFKVGAGWGADNAWYAIYCFDNSDDSKYTWVALTTLADCETDVYKGSLPGNSFDKIIVCRMNKASKTLSFDNKWNQTGNLEYPTTNFQFTPTSLSGDECTGTWGTYSVPTFTISYNAGTGGSGSRGNDSKSCNVAFTLPSSAVFTRTGYTQTGWALTENGSQSHALGGSYTTNADQTFYPVWTAKSCDITFDKNDGSGGSDGTSATYDATMTSITPPTRAGYDFGGYYDAETDDNGSGTKYYNANGTSANTWDKNTTSTTTLYAKWTAHTYTVNLDHQGGSCEKDTLRATYNATLPKTARFATPTKDGYTFKGYYTQPAGSGDIRIITDGRKWNSNKTDYLGDSKLWIYTGADPLTLYARWDQTVVLDANDGSADGSVTLVWNRASKSGSVTSPTYAGHTVDLGYFAEAACTNKVLDASGNLQTSVTVNAVPYTDASHKWVKEGATTLYAHWKCNTPTISFSNDATNTVTITIPSGTTVYYTTDGSTPTGSSTEYTEPFTIDATKTIKAIAIQSGCTNSGVQSQTCTYTAPTYYNVSHSLTNVTKSSGSAGANAATESVEYTAVFAAAENYILPATITVTIGGESATAGSDYTWSQRTGTVTIPGSNVTGNIAISISGVATEDNYWNEFVWKKSENYGGDGKCMDIYDANTLSTIVSGVITAAQSTATIVGGKDLTMDRPTSVGTDFVLTFDVGPADYYIRSLCTYGKIEESAGAYYSWDGGEHWTKIAEYSFEQTKTFDAPDATYPTSFIIKYTCTSTSAGGIYWRNAQVELAPIPACSDPGLGFASASKSVTLCDDAPTNALTNTHGVTVSYTSSNTSVATVASDGAITLKGAGETTITASSSIETVSAVNYCADEATYTITVAPSTAAGLSYSSTSVEKDYGASNFTNTLTNSNSLTGVTYESSVTTVATVDEETGEVTIVGPGTTTITASSEQQKVSSTCYAAGEASYTLTVYPVYTVSYNAMGGTCSPTTENTTTVLGKVTLPSATHASYTTYEWVISNGSSVGDADEEYTPTANITLYAKWQGDCAGGGGGSTTLFAWTKGDGAKIESDETSLNGNGMGNMSTGTSIVARKLGTNDINNSANGYKLGNNDVAIEIQGTSNFAVGDVVTITGRSGNSNSDSRFFVVAPTTVGTVMSGGFETSDTVCTNSFVNDDSDGEYSVTLKSAQAGSKIRIFRIPGKSMLVKSIIVTRSGGTCYTVTYHGNGATGGYTNDPAQYAKDADPEVLDCGYTRTGYAFIGWCTMAVDDGTGTWYQPGDVIEDIDDDVTLYAIWKQIKYFTGAVSTTSWNTDGNWSPSGVPAITDPVVIQANVTVDINNAKALRVDIETGNTLTINAGKALIIAETLTKNGGATAAADVIINSDRTTNGVGALVIGGETGTNKATVNFETKAKNDGGWVNQFIGSPFSDNEPYVDYAIQLYKFEPRANGDRGWWWTHSSGTMTPFWGYNVLYNDASELDVTWTGTLNASTSKTISGLYYNGSSETDNMFANSWTAPIHVGAFEDADFVNASTTLYMFNAGTPAQEAGHSGVDATYSNDAPGTYISIPIHSASYAGIGVIPSMQAFYVEATSSGASITLDYNKVVYTPALTDVGIVPNRAPRRSAAVDEPEVIKLHVQSETGWAADTYVMGRADFAEGYEDGWDGAYIEGESATPKLYTPSIDGDMFINCLPQIDGTVVGFRKGSDDSAYTFSFKYDGEDEYYLKDLKLDIETRIDNDHTYFFTTEDGDSATRFIIVRKTPAVATGSDNVDAEAAQARKLIIDNKVYIIRGGRMYNATGALVK